MRKYQPSEPVRTLQERLSEKIQAGKIVAKLSGHVHDPDNHPLTQTQLNAARILLNKIIPDLRSIEVKPLQNQSPESIATTDLLRIIDGESTRK